MRRLRLILGAVVAAALLPAIWLRDPDDLRWVRGPVAIAEIPLAPHSAGPATLEKAWVLGSEDSRFGGYSAMILRDDSELVAVSDSGRLMHVDLSAGGTPQRARLDRFMRIGKLWQKGWFDVEGMTRDPATGQIWQSVEGRNGIFRYDSDFNRQSWSQPPLMYDWSSNGGAEAIVRLADGRFIVLQESARDLFGKVRRGLLFASDPAVSPPPAPVAFTVTPPGGFAPVDMVQVPDGRVLVLLRKLTWPWPPRFAAALALADPAQIAPGGDWPLTLLAVFGKDWPSDNYEGLALAPLANGDLRLWVIADDNGMQYLQRTILLRLRRRLDPAHAKGARGPAARP